MKKLLGSIITGLILLIGACAFGGCSTSKPEGFAIYLSTDPITPYVTAALNDISLSSQPVIGLEDILSYNSEVHQIQLTARAFERVVNLQVPMSGQPFVVCVDKKPVYAGAFMSVISSYRCPGVAIMQPVSSRRATIGAGTRAAMPSPCSPLKKPAS